MPAPWYERYFTEDYWAYADAEYTTERTETEVAYLAGVLARASPGPRVVDLGCGVGRHAVRLAARGYQVTGLDISGYALERARSAARAAGVAVTFRRLDLLSGEDWGVGAADAVVCVQAFGWGGDDDQLRLLRRVRRLLVPDGVLILDHSSALAIARIYRSSGHATIDGAEFEFRRSYDPATGRSGGEVRIRRADGSTVVLPDDVRLYTPAEIRTLLVRAGFESTMDADFVPGAPVGLDTRYVQFVARPAPVPASALAGHRGGVPEGTLDLRWAPDEADFVAAPIARAWASVRSRGPVGEAARRYDVADPYGGARCAPGLSAQLGADLDADRVLAGAGATGLLHGLARLADAGGVLVDPSGHPELPRAAGLLGSPVTTAPLGGLDVALGAVERYRPAVTVLDRPGLVGRLWTVDEVRALASAVSGGGGVLVVDETCGGYLPPGLSSAPVTSSVPGLVVLRSLSKGYCCGGLRVGFAICSADLAVRLREVLAPLAVSALALDVALALVTQPDPLAALRTRIAEVKPSVVAALSVLSPVDSCPYVPWVAFPAEAAPALDDLGLRAKEAQGLLRLSVPLSAARLAAFHAAVGRAVDAPA